MWPTIVVWNAFGLHVLDIVVTLLIVDCCEKILYHWKSRHTFLGILLYGTSKCRKVGIAKEFLVGIKEGRSIDNLTRTRMLWWGEVSKSKQCDSSLTILTMCLTFVILNFGARKVVVQDRDNDRNNLKGNLYTLTVHIWNIFVSKFCLCFFGRRLWDLAVRYIWTSAVRLSLNRPKSSRFTSQLLIFKTTCFKVVLSPWAFKYLTPRNHWMYDFTAQSECISRAAG